MAEVRLVTQGPLAPSGVDPSWWFLPVSRALASAPLDFRPESIRARFRDTWQTFAPKEPLNERGLVMISDVTRGLLATVSAGDYKGYCGYLEEAGTGLARTRVGFDAIIRSSQLAWFVFRDSIRAAAPICEAELLSFFYHSAEKITETYLSVCAIPDKSDEYIANRLERLHDFNELTFLASQNLSLDQYVPLALERIVSLVGAESGSVLVKSSLLDGDPDTWTMHSALGLPVGETLRFPLQHSGSVQLTALTSGALRIPQSADYPHYNQRERELLSSWRVQSALGTAVRSSTEPVGMVYVNYSRPYGFSIEDSRYFTHAAPIIGNALNRIASTQSTETGHARTTLLQSLLESALQQRQVGDLLVMLQDALGLRLSVILPSGEVLAGSSRLPPGTSERLWGCCLQSEGTPLAGLAQDIDGFAICAVRVDGTVAACLAASGSADSVTTRLAIVEAARVLGSHQSFRSGPLPIVQRSPQGLMESLLSGTADAADLRAWAQGPDSPATPYRVLMVTQNGAADPAAEDGCAEWQRSLLNQLSMTCSGHLCSAYGSELAAVVPDAGLTPAAVSRLKQTVLRAEGDGADGSLHLVITRPFSQFADVRLAINEARSMLALAKTLNRRHVCSPEELGVYSLFVGGQQTRGPFVDGLIGDLVRYDRLRGGDLVATVETFMDNNCSVKATSAALFIHPNTLRYRLAKARELVGVDWAENDGRLSIHLAIKLHRVAAEPDVS